MVEVDSQLTLLAILPLGGISVSGWPSSPPWAIMVTDLDVQIFHELSPVR
jgi:hypothetical protein